MSCSASGRCTTATATGAASAPVSITSALITGALITREQQVMVARIVMAVALLHLKLMLSELDFNVLSEPLPMNSGRTCPAHTPTQHLHPLRRPDPGLLRLGQFGRVSCGERGGQQG